MAETNRRLYNVTRGSLAYDLDTVVREEAPEIRRERRHQPAGQPRIHPHAREKAAASPLVLGSIALLCAMVMVLLLGYVQLTKVSAHVSSVKDELSELSEEHISLLTAYEKTFDLATVKQVAEEAGMSKPNAGQIEYIDISGSDDAVVLRSGGSKLVSGTMTTVRASALHLWEYFR